MLATLLTALLASAAPATDCHIGAYRLSDGSTLDIAPTDSDALRWRRIDGASGKLTRGANDTWSSTLGWTDRPDGKDVRFADCAKGRIDFGGMAGERIPLQVQQTTFTGDGGTRLVGRLILPPGDAKVPVVVLVHGAEHDSAQQFDAMQREFPAQGVGAFVYDKRGTGDSAGTYTQDYSVLANDAVAAVAEARRLAGARAGRVGFRGGSQGGWVAPLAATRTKVDFLIIGYGLAVSPLEEDREAVAFYLHKKGYDQAVIDKAWQLSDAIGLILSSNLTQGFNQLEVAKAKYSKEPWYKDVRGDFSYMVLPMSSDEIREKGKPYASWNTPWHYDSMAVLRKLKTPQLWQLGEDDIDAPSGETWRRLTSLQLKGLPITVALFPHAEHGMTEYELKPDGERVSTRYAAGYMQMAIDYAKGIFHTPYGASVVVVPREPAP
ncbi:CocE/NonD family hydrolase [Dyella sp.]|uniref:alpha/beta hydrolase family protein n=1 Tax=Dyella sp. TaxID=1869338 RepID=UPI0028438FA1|nr:CocE/NonD family hydrolase [Dyella sp.]MDR3447450.1 alpha/beta hydrolase [Dyella sp.]